MSNENFVIFGQPRSGKSYYFGGDYSALVRDLGGSVINIGPARPGETRNLLLPAIGADDE